MKVTFADENGNKINEKWMKEKDDEEEEEGKGKKWWGREKERYEE